MNQTKEEKIRAILHKLMLLFLILVVTASSYCGFFSKWSFRDGAESFGIEAMLSQTARRPFVHRQLIPAMAREVESLLPSHTKEKLQHKLELQKPIEGIYARAEIPPSYRIEYYLVFIFSFVFFFASICMLRRILITVTESENAGTLGAFLFAILVPFFENMGGYFYDLGELFFFFAAINFALQGNWLLLLILTPFATANKEAFFFFLITLLPLYAKKIETKKALLAVGSCVLASGLTYLWVRSLYTGNSGGMVEFQLMKHINALFQLKDYYVTSTVYGMPMGAGFFFLHVAYAAWIVRYSWKLLPAHWKQHAYIALGVNLPLYLLFCFPSELRNLSMLYPTFTILMSYYIRDLLRKEYE